MKSAYRSCKGAVFDDKDNTAAAAAANAIERSCFSSSPCDRAPEAP